MLILWLAWAAGAQAGEVVVPLPGLQQHYSLDGLLSPTITAGAAQPKIDRVTLRLQGDIVRSMFLTPFPDIYSVPAHFRVQLGIEGFPLVPGNGLWILAPGEYVNPVEVALPNFWWPRGPGLWTDFHQALRQGKATIQLTFEPVLPYLPDRATGVTYVGYLLEPANGRVTSADLLVRFPDPVHAPEPSAALLLLGGAAASFLRRGRRRSQVLRAG